MGARSLLAPLLAPAQPSAPGGPAGWLAHAPGASGSRGGATRHAATHAAAVSPAEGALRNPGTRLRSPGRGPPAADA